MAETKTQKKRVSRSRTTASTKKAARKKTSKVSSNETREMISHISKVTQRQIRNLGDKVISAKDREKLLLKDITEKVRNFANKATQLTKLKIELHNLREEHEDLLKVMGDNLWNMHKADKVTNIKSKFRYDFKRLEDLESEINKKKKSASEITAYLKTIK
jgi:tRNA U34 5-carboxymethylaminomethyl modifying GTPase MnmE/TrmE